MPCHDLSQMYVLGFVNTSFAAAGSGGDDMSDELIWVRSHAFSLPETRTLSLYPVLFLSLSPRDTHSLTLSCALSLSLPETRTLSLYPVLFLSLSPRDTHSLTLSCALFLSLSLSLILNPSVLSTTTEKTRAALFLSQCACADNRRTPNSVRVSTSEHI